MFCKTCSKPCMPQFDYCFEHRKRWIVQQNGKTITSVYNQWSMAHSFIQSHITLPIYKELKIVELI